MPKKSREKIKEPKEKSHIEKEQSEIKKELREEEKKRENLENFRERNGYTEKEIRMAEAVQLEETKKRIWGKESEPELEQEEELDAESEKKAIMEILEKENGEEQDEQKEKGSKQEKFSDTFKRIKKGLEEKKHRDTTGQEKHSDTTEQKKHPYATQEGYIDATKQGERSDTAEQEQKKAEKKSEDLRQMELKQDLLTALDKPIENLVENDANIKKCDEKIWDLKKGLIKPLFTYKKIKGIEIAKEVAIEEKEKARQAIDDIENKYVLEGKGFLTGTEIREIIIKKVKEEKGKGQEKTTLELREPRENIDATGQENFDTTERKGNIDVALSEKEKEKGNPPTPRLRRTKKEKKRLNKDKIKRGAIKAGRGAKTGAGILGVIALTITGAWLSFSSGVVEWAKKNNIKMP